MIKHGLKPIQRDVRDRSFQKTFTPVPWHKRLFGGTIPVLQDNFSVDSGLTMPDQNVDGLFLGCTAYAQLELCTDQDGIIYDDYKFQYDKTLAFEGVFDETQGCDIRDSLKMICTIGPKKKGDDNSADSYAKRRGAYYSLELYSGLDWFDTIRHTIETNFQLNKLKCSVSIGTPWFAEFEPIGNGNGKVVSDGLISDIPVVEDINNLDWHNWKIAGCITIQGQAYLLAKTWQGKNYGSNGWVYFSRNAINAIMTIKFTGAFTVAPLNTVSPQTIQKTLAEVVIQWMNVIISLFQKKVVLQSIPPVPASISTPEAPIQSVVATLPTNEEILRFDTVTDAEHAIRVKCDKAGLNLRQKNEVCATIYGESEFMNYLKDGTPTIHKNLNKDGSLSSTDWGICQINDWWHIGKGKDFPNVEFVMDNPDKAVDFMILMYKAGKISLWNAYGGKDYQKYLATH